MQQLSPPTFQISFQLASNHPELGHPAYGASDSISHGFPGPSVSMQVAAVRKHPATIPSSHPELGHPACGASSPASDEAIEGEESDAGWKMFKRATQASDEAIEGDESELEEVRDEPEEEEEEEEEVEEEEEEEEEGD